MDAYRSANRALWDEWAEVNASSEMYGLENFKKGACSLHALELSELGEVNGKMLLHLQCHFGQDTLSWARRGATVTGADFSPRAIDLAQSLSRELGIPARFICCDLYDLPNHLQGQFDIVFTSYGVLAWLPDLAGWAQVAVRYLRPGGLFYLAEFHPFALVFDDGAEQPRLHYPYFASEPMACEVQGSYADRSAAVQQAVAYEWAYPLGAVVTALLQAGLRLRFLHEHDYAVYQMLPWLVEGEDGNWHPPPEMTNLPLMFSLLAEKTG